MISFFNLFIAILTIQCVFSQDSNRNALVAKNAAGNLDFMDKAKAFGFDCEKHEVITKDGYVLTLFNIKGNVNKSVFVLHGVIDSSDTFFLRGNKSMLSKMAKRGDNIWLGNIRGNKYSKKHTTLDPEKDSRAYWDFSMHELAIYDLAAMLDYVLEATGLKKIKAIGHSQGNAVFYALGASKPEYNDKVELLIALAPICYLHHVRDLVRVLVDVAPVLGPVLQLLGLHELVPKVFSDFIKALCSIEGIGYAVCAKGVFFPIAGWDTEEMEPDFFPTVISRYPDTTSIKNAQHLAQISLRRKFAQYDHGLLGNLKVYKSFEPPLYNLSRVLMPVALVGGLNDNLSAMEDVNLLNSQLGNVVNFTVLERKKANHIDHVWGQNMDNYLFPLVFDLLDNYPGKL